MNSYCRYMMPGLFLLFSVGSKSQHNTPLPYPCDTLDSEAYEFLHLSENRITDPDHTLLSFYRSLSELEREGTPLSDTVAPPVVSLLHIGDSHIQAGFLTNEIRKTLQQRFGNAGRGLIVPYKLARTNEPRDYRIISNETWTNEKCIRNPMEQPAGIGGLSLSATAPRFSLLIRTYATDSCIDPRFNLIRVFRHEYAPELLEDEIYNTDTHCCEYELNPPFLSEIPLNQLTDSIVLTGETDSYYNRPVYYGFSLENGRPGILYHAAGINGACFAHFARQEGFIEQTSALAPRLIILSFGTNESAMNRFEPAVFYYQIDRLVSALRKANPGVPVLLVTPVENYRSSGRRGKKTYIPNKNIREAAAIIRRYATDHKLAYWDLHRVAGGPHGQSEWLIRGLFQKDRIHFTPEGYRLQGALFYQALMRDYYSYLYDHER